MHAVELEKSYNPASFEDRIYKQWEEAGAFKPETCPADSAAEQGKKKKPFVNVIPPPNVTGILHLGHALQSSLEDISIRYHRMKGEPTLWMPGTDHAGIATQNVVERRLKEKGKTRFDLGREKFIEETWKVKEEHHAIIVQQLKKMGASCDWSRERFTMDEGCSKAVREVFVSLYERNLLYKGQYLVNWCSSCGTALADDEVDHWDENGGMYYIKYKVVSTSSTTGGDSVVEPVETTYLTIATTRPETLLGDTAVAVNPEDERYKALVGKMLELPLTGRQIPVIADHEVDKDFGTGCLKVTPAHSPADWEIGKRHGLEVINILNPDGSLNNTVPEKYRGMNVKDARKAVIEDLKAQDLFIKDEKIKHSVGHCYRCNTVIEPFLSEQWFVRMKPLAEKALAAWRAGEIEFFPRKWENTYRNWLENIRDWCISRQIWWGHRIPAWYCDNCEQSRKEEVGSRKDGEVGVIVSRTEPEKCPYCGADKSHLHQDPDVLDTWFSSWLWPFSTMGWEHPLPDCPSPLAGEAGWGGEAPDFYKYYPTTTLITGFDIIFFWVSRMIMAGLEFTGKAPFHDIVITGLIRDKQGRKMSKSLGNGVDPLEIIKEYGADALRFTLAFLCAQGQDILLDKESFKVGSKFANKIWNASRYILMNLEGRELVDKPALKPADRWIYSRLNGTAKAMNEALMGYRFNDASQTAYEYFWNDFCDWYVEASKLSMRAGDEAEKNRAVTVLLDVLEESLRLVHPLLPFVSEEIYDKVGSSKEEVGRGLLVTSPYPQYDESRNDQEAEAEFGFLQELVTKIRTLRSEFTVPPDKKIKVDVNVADSSKSSFLNEQQELVKLLANIGELDLRASAPSRENTISLIGTGWEAHLYLADVIDMSALKQKFEKELANTAKYTAGLEQRLSNEAFTAKAPPELVEQEKAKLVEAKQRSEKLQSYIKGMNG
ncbi:MAG: valine--tRNA ligase [Spirochaetaceae bacterium]|jgi:valyl-tRNA synthetase|nr:valine--tRNA ligase [Spirochaetaceae bacterium]